MLGYADIRKAAEAIIANHGQENYAAAKRVELVLDGMLSNGWTDAMGRRVEPNEDYIAAKGRLPGAAALGDSGGGSLLDGVDELPEERPRESRKTDVGDVFRRKGDTGTLRGRRADGTMGTKQSAREVKHGQEGQSESAGHAGAATESRRGAQEKNGNRSGVQAEDERDVRLGGQAQLRERHARLTQEAADYGLTAHIRGTADWPESFANTRAYTSGGEIYIREDVPDDIIQQLIPHEAAHAMRQVGYPAYMEFIQRVPEMLDLSADAGQRLFAGAAAHRGLDIFNLTRAQADVLYDEINAILSGAVISGADKSILPELRSAFYDYDTYAAELKRIHNQFRRENQKSRKTDVGDVFRRKGDVPPGVRNQAKTSATPDVQFSDGTSMTAQEFVNDYIATHEGATMQDANRVYSEAVRLNQAGMKFPAARKQESTAARSSVSPSSRKSRSEGKRTAAGKAAPEGAVRAERSPSRVQRWTASYASALLKGSKIQGIDIAFDGFGDGERGYYLDGRIVLNGNTLTTQRAIMQVLGHELTHSAYDTDASIVDDILKTARRTLGNDRVDRTMEETRERYIRFLMEQKGLSRDAAVAQMTPAAVKQEVAGDFMFDVFSDGALTRRLGKEAPSIMTKARDMAARLLERLVGARGTDAAAARSELEWLMDRLDGALHANEPGDTMGAKRSSVEDPAFQTEERPILYPSPEQERQRDRSIDAAATEFGLSPDEVSSISLYVSGSAYEWTSIQRDEGKFEQTPITDFFIGQTLAGLERMPTFRGRTYRNLRFTEESAYRAFLQEHETGADVTLRAFTSASKDPNGYIALGDYAVHLVIDGVSGHDIADNFSLPGQREVIYLPGAVLRIDSVTTANDGHPLIYAKERADNENLRASFERGVENAVGSDEAGFEGAPGEDGGGGVPARILPRSMEELGVPDDQPRPTDAPEARGRELIGETNPEGGQPRYSVELDQLVDELAQIEVTGIPGQVTMEEAAVLQKYLELPDARTTLEAIPDDVYVVFDSEQVKSVHNEGTFDPANPDIRYSVSSTQPFAEQVQTALEEDVAKNRYSALYIRSTPSMLRELGLPDAPMAMTARHVKDINHAPGDNLSWHGIPEEQIARIPELLDQPAMVLESGTRPGDIIVVTTELDSEGRPIVLTVHPNGRALVDGRPVDTNFITSMYGRNNFGRFLDAVVRNGGVLYWDKNRSQDLLTAARVQFPAGMRDLASNSIIRKIGGSVNENRSRPLSSVARVQSPAALTASASDTTISQPGTDVNGESGSGTPRFSVQEGNVNPDTGYETGSVADSVMRMINAGDVDEALKMMGDVLKQFQKIEAEQASRKKQSNAAAAFRPRKTLTEDLIAKNKRTIEELIEKYGAMEQTSAAQRTVLLPKAIDKETKVRGVMQTAAATENTPEYLLSEIERSILDGDEGATYVSIGDKGSLKRAENLLKDKGFETLLHEWRAKIDSGVRLDKTDIVMAEKLYVEAANNKDTATAMQLLSEIAMAGTQSGQIVQAMTMLKNMTPSGQLYYLQKTVDRFNTEHKDLRLLGKEITIDPALARKLLEAKTQEEIDAAMGELIQNIADQLPVTLLDRWNAWRYLSMLGNPRTHVRNFMGNAVFVPVRLAKDVLATITESQLQRAGIISQEERTKAFSTKETRDFAKADAVEMERILRGGGKQNIADQIRDARKIFGDTPIEWLSRKNSELLEREDWFFLRGAYEHALAGFLAARKADVSTLSGADATREGRALLNEARAYAVREAQKATYRDVSKLASMLSHLKRTGGKGTQIFLDGLIPFTKTPINIVKRGVEYSPVGLLKSVTADLNRVRKGEISATEAVDNICAGLTGTGVVAMGWFLASSGWLVGGLGDEPEDEFQELQGEQSYSLRIGDVSYTIDWTAPVALPLFVGVEAYRARASEFSAGDLPDAIATLLEPVLSLSMLDGLNKTLASVRYDSADQALANILKTVGGSYLTQGVPTLAGQIARTMDDSRRTSFTPTGMGSLQSWASRTYQTSVLGKIPVASEQRMLYIDAWGRSDTQPNVALRALENFLSPGYANTIQTTSVDRELIRLAEETKDTGVFPKRAAKYFTVGGEQYAMTQDEYEAHLIERGQMSYQLVSDLTSTPDYAKLPDEAKAQAVQAAYTYASELAKYHTNSGYDADSWVLRLRAAEDELNLDPSDYFIAKALSKQSGGSLREAALGAGFDPATTASVIAADFSAQGSFTDPYTPGYEYVLSSAQKERYESMFREKFVTAYTDYGLEGLTGTELSDEVSDLVSEVNAEVKREMSDWLYGQGISPTQKK